MSAIASSTKPSLIDSGRTLLSDLLRPAYFERNAFRILELPVDTTRRQIDKRIQTIELAIQNRMAMPTGSGRCLPLADAPDTSALGEARNRMTDVRRRFVDELFWFWPDPDSAATAATALAVGQTNEAVAAWKSQEDVGPNDPGGLAAIHNIATFYLLSALSMAESEEQASDREEAPGAFEEALFRWQILLESPAFWSRLEARAQEINHPRLADVVPALRAALPSVVAALPLLGFASVPVPLARKLINLLRESGLPKDAAEHALGQAARSLSQRILSASQAAKDAADSSPLHAAQTCTVFLDHVEPWLGIVDQLLPSSDSTRIKAHDEAALAVLSCQVVFCKETDGWDLGIPLLERGTKLAASDDTVAKFKSNLETIRKYHERNDDFRGPGYHDLPKDLFDELEKARHEVQAKNFDPAINQLRTLHKRGGPHTPAVSKALAYTLGCCSHHRLNHGTDNLSDPVDYISSKLKERVHSPAFMLTALMAQAGSLSSGAECMICGQRIYGSYATLRIPDLALPVIVCSSCSAKLDRMKDERKSQLRNTFQRALDELYEATDLDPTNRWVNSQIADSEKIARDIGITIRKPSKPAKLSLVPATRAGSFTPAARPTSASPPKPSEFVSPTGSRKPLRWLSAVGLLVVAGFFFFTQQNVERVDEARQPAHSAEDDRKNANEALRVRSPVLIAENAGTLGPIAAPSVSSNQVTFPTKIEEITAPKTINERAMVMEKAAAQKEVEHAIDQKISAPAHEAGAFENSLGMKFLPVTEVLFCIWPTRVQDFEAFVKATGYRATAWRQPGFEQGPDHPVVRVSWHDAMAFCKWLTQKERSEGVLESRESYRLPTDREWSRGVGLPDEPGETPEARDMGVADVYPWGKQWPPQAGAGNYTGEETGSDVAIRGYHDGYAWTSPIGSFKANKLGVYDMGGNVWQWCMDWWNDKQMGKVLRGASWYNGALKLSLLSSCRINAAPSSNTDNHGFRIVKTSEAAKPPRDKADPSLDASSLSASRKASSNGQPDVIASRTVAPVKAPLTSVVASQVAPANILTTASGLRYEVIRLGSGRKPLAGSRVQVRSEQISEDGKVLRSSGKLEEYSLPGLVRGLSEGIQLMPVGSKFRFRISPKLGDGKALIFEIELTEIL